jgi:FkbM family methyltransferase
MFYYNDNKNFNNRNTHIQQGRWSALNECINKNFPNYKWGSVLDIGAGSGDSQYQYEMLNPKMIYCFEPDINCSQKPVERENKKLIQKAVSDKEGIYPFYKLLADSAGNSLHVSTNKNEWTKIDIETIRIDKWSERENIKNIEIVDIDTQGHDYQVILGLGNLIDNIKIIKTECWFNDPYLGDGGCYKDVDQFYKVWSYLADKGFVLWTLESIMFINNQISWGDAIFYKK